TTCSQPNPAAVTTTLVDVERLQRPYHPRRATGVPRRRRATSTSRYRPRRRRADAPPEHSSALDVERPGAPLLPPTAAAASAIRGDVDPDDERERATAPG